MLESKVDFKPQNNPVSESRLDDNRNLSNVDRRPLLEKARTKTGATREIIFQPFHHAVSRFNARLLLSFFVVVFICPAIYGGYLAFFASDRFTTEFRVSVKSAEPLQQAGISALLGMGMGGGSAIADANAVVQYLKSLQGVTDIDQQIDLKSRFGSQNIDYFSRFSTTEPNERLLRYWTRMTKAFFEPSTSTVVVQIDAFTPLDSLEIANTSVRLAEQLINNMSARQRDEAVGFAQKEVAKAEQRLARATLEMNVVMDKEGTVDPKLSAQSLISSLTKARDNLSELKAKLSAQTSSLSDDAPPVVQTKIKIAAAQTELDRLSGLMTGSSNGPTLSSSVAAFTRAETERMFAERAYQSALATFETAKVEAARRQAYLQTIVRPQIAQEASFPKPFLSALTAVGICFLIWLVAIITISAIKEHM